MDPISMTLTVAGSLAPQIVTELRNLLRDRRKQSKSAEQNLIFLKQFVEIGRIIRVSLPIVRVSGQVDFLYSKVWFQRFKDAIYDAEDTIYSYKFAIDEKQINNIHEIFEAIDDKNGHKVVYSEKLIQKEIPTWRRTTYLMSRIQIEGRAIQTDKLKNWLLNDQPSNSNTNFSILSIIDTGGIGKTILSQLVFNNQVVQQNFEVMAWVSLCDPYNPNIYIKANESTSVSGNSDPFDFVEFHNKFESKMMNKRYFMVLDDAWDKLFDEWDTYRSLFNRGKNGSKVIVTTQLEGKANLIDSDSRINLDVLQPHEYLKLFQECASSKNHSVLDDVGRSISERFGCLPLVAVEVGRQLKCSLEQEGWNSILHNKFWIADRRDGDIISILGLCYEQLPRRLKQCYLCCALFPRNYQFEKHQLNLIWIGMGFVHSGSPTGNYVDDFSKRSFFIDTTRKNDKYVFYPVLHELAEYISDGEYFRLEEQTMESESIKIPEDARHVYISADNFVKASEALSRNEKLRSLIIIGGLSNSCDEKFFMKSFERVLKNLKFLRFLVLSVLPQNLSKTVGKLKYLRYFEFPSNQQTSPELSDSLRSNYKLKRWDSKYLLVAKDIDELIKLHCSSANIVDANIVDATI